MNSLDMNALMKIISKMDKKDLEAGLAKAQEILKQKDKGNTNWFHIVKHYFYSSEILLQY